jgi:dynein heavy chain
MIYTNVSRGLFEAHKIIYSFLIITSINRNQHKIKDLHWNVLLRGAGPTTIEQQRNKPKNPDVKIITVLGWDLVFYVEICDPEVFGGIS